MRLTRKIIRTAVRRWLTEAVEMTLEDLVRKEAGILSTLTKEEERFLFDEVQLIVGHV